MLASALKQHHTPFQNGASGFLEDLIARRLALPVEKRMNFLRRDLPGGGSCL
jgi:hypothetical protein